MEWIKEEKTWCGWSNEMSALFERKSSGCWARAMSFEKLSSSSSSSSSMHASRLKRVQSSYFICYAHSWCSIHCYVVIRHCYYCIFNSFLFIHNVKPSCFVTRNRLNATTMCNVYCKAHSMHVYTRAYGWKYTCTWFDCPIW